MLTSEILSALAIGFLGSAHCIGMCGPIAIALPYPQLSVANFIFGRVIYNLGRVLTYSVFGAIFGLFGSKIIIAGFQQFVTIILGIIILLIVITPFKYKTVFSQNYYIQKLSSPIKHQIAKLFKQGTIPAMFLIGVLNGWLPCGLVYVAIAGAIISGDAIAGMSFMFLFGLGTFPAMFSATIFGKFINVGIRNKIRKLIPSLTIVFALLLVLRGLELGIPFISPEISANPTTQSELQCHPK